MIITMNLTSSFSSFLFFFFKSKYVGDEQEQKYLQMTGVNLMDKTLIVQGARISFSLWDVGGMYKNVTVWSIDVINMNLVICSCVNKYMVCYLNSICR